MSLRCHLYPKQKKMVSEHGILAWCVTGVGLTNPDKLFAVHCRAFTSRTFSASCTYCWGCQKHALLGPLQVQSVNSRVCQAPVRKRYFCISLSSSVQHASIACPLHRSCPYRGSYKDRSAGLQAKGVPSVQAVYTEEDFLVENYREWGLSDDALRRIKDLMVGEPVEPADCTESELKAAGYTSWKQYEVCAALRAW